MHLDNPKDPNTYYYRFESSCDSVWLEQWMVVKHTPCGIWLERPDRMESEKGHWVAHNSRKKFAYPTLAEARDAFVARKRSAMFHFECKIDNQKICLQKIGTVFSDAVAKEAAIKTLKAEWLEDKLCPDLQKTSKKNFAPNLMPLSNGLRYSKPK